MFTACLHIARKVDSTYSVSIPVNHTQHRMEKVKNIDGLCRGFKNVPNKRPLMI